MREGRGAASMKLYSHFEAALFVERDNRFVMTLRQPGGEPFKAYIANPGRMEEFLVKDHPFYITTGNNGKYDRRIVSTTYQDSCVLLDTIKINRVVEQLLRENRIAAFSGPKTLRREVTVDRSKFDFLVEREGRKPALLEIKSCSLCHRGVAMFPDAPTSRGKRHLEDLEALAAGEYDTYTLYLVTHSGARSFIPNGHTDPDYCSVFNRSKKVRFLAFSALLSDPVTLDMDSLREIPIDFEKSRIACQDKGSYLLVLYNEKPFTRTIGSLGEREFRAGYYVYCGSALRGLESRIRRHLKKRKKQHWHLDAVTPGDMKTEKVFRIRRDDRIEESLARGLAAICDGSVPGFGATDSGEDSHLFYFTDRPYRRREFLDLLLNYRMFIA